MKMIRTLLLLIVAITVVGGGLLSSPADVHAQSETPIAEGLESVSETIVLPANDPRVIAARIINVVLGLLAIILVSILVYAGFLYMTSGGDSEKTRTALLWIRNAIIGLIIILLSWAIARYVIAKLSEAVLGDGGSGQGPTGPPGGFGGTSGDQVFRVISITPSGEIESKKIVVKIVFNKAVDEESAQAPGNVVVEELDGTPVPGTITVIRSAVHFTPSEPCPEPNDNKFCFEDNTNYRVRVEPALQSVSGLDLTCGGFAPDCEGAFMSGTTVDVTPPSVSITFPLDNFPVSADALVDVAARVTDDVAVGYVSFFDNGEPIGDDAPVGSSPRSFNGHVQWDTAGLTPGDVRTLTATAYDTDTGVTTSDPISAIIRPAHCFDDVQNEGETGVDCGGDVNSVDYCGACSGGACTENSDCASGFCVNGLCVDQPIITSVEPDNGAVGTYVTLRGQNFGSNGSVYFLGPGNADPVEAVPPQACLNEGVSTWSSTQIVVEVPEGAMNGPLRVHNNYSDLTDDTNAPPGPDIADFLVNNQTYPGICAAVPNAGRPSDLFRLLGTGFGSTSAEINFGDSAIASISWADAEIEAYVPNVLVGSYPVSVSVDTGTSNSVTMDVFPASGGGAPEIFEISPVQGPVGAYVTILGRNFGYQPGQVFFMNQLTQEVALADTDFPPECAEGYWSDRNIVIKVPRQYTQGGTGSVPPGPYAVWVKTARPTAPESNRENFGVNEDPLRPGICAIVPRVAPQGTDVTIHGEYLTAGPGVVRYTSNRVDSPSSWTNRTLFSRIPAGAETGPVVAEPASINESSNPYLLEVRNCNETVGICSTSEECCGDGSCREIGQCPEGVDPAMFAWQFSTGIIPRAPRVVEQCEQELLPSPAPWSVRPGGQEACVNDVIGILFSTRLDPTTVNPDSFHVYQCASAGSDPCSERTEIESFASMDATDGEESTYVRIRPGMFDPSTWYEVAVRTTIRGDGEAGIYMEEDAERCGEGNAYCFRFRTRDDPGACEVGSVLVAPDPYTAYEMGETVGYVAVPRPVGDICRLLDCDPYDWSWDTDPPRADITNSREGGLGACRQTATARLETEPGAPVQVSALETASDVVGSGDLTIQFTDPLVVNHGPDCDTTCINAAIWAEFNIAMDPSSMTADDIDVYRCTNENCNEYMEPDRLNLSAPSTIVLETVPGVANDDRMRFLKIEPLRNTDDGPQPLLEPGRFYQVVLKSDAEGGIRSAAGTPLAGLNHPDGFSWTFRVKYGDDEAWCTPDRVDVSPTEKYETIVGAKQGFAATPFTAPDACSEKGQPLISLSGYEWATSDELVAELYRDGQIDTGSNLPPGCTSNCTLKGAYGRSGMTAQCGNGIVETTLASYCSGGTTRFGQSCTLIDPRGSGGEECDGEANCNSLCLWEPVDTVNEGRTCGNNWIDYGEDCDFGRTCRGTENQIIPDDRPCNDPDAETQCIANGGTCETRLMRGCSLNCRNLGANAGGSTCGNNDIGDGEDCDDGNNTSGDGCSANCLHEGSRPAEQVVALCGNGYPLEPGESCEASGGKLPDSCDPDTCLNTGRRPCLFTSSNPNPRFCCGNGTVESGEDCDDGNSQSGDGCSAVCLREGSSPLYDVPSFCGDEVPGLGEAPQCEAAPPQIIDGRTDGFQVAVIVGEANFAAGEDTMSTEIRATYEGKTGEAIYGLRCGFTDERSCHPTNRNSISAGYGLTSNGCCSYRPRLVDNTPPNGLTNVCRNALISGSFNTLMDVQSLTNNFVVARSVVGTACPEGMSPLTMEEGESDFGSGVSSVILGFWNALKGFFGIDSANAQAVRWCTGSATGVLQFGEGLDSYGRSYTTFALTLDGVLEPNTEYRVRFIGDRNLGDNASVENRTGIRTSSGVVAVYDQQWSFTTGEEICTINEIDVNDETIEHPNFFLESNESHPFIASALSIRNGRAEYISATPQYAWQWQNWALSNNRIANIEPPVEPDANALLLSTSERSVVSTATNGSGFVSARLRITADEASVPSTEGHVVQGTAPITVNVCENPWPSRIAAPFRDEFGSLSLDETIFENGPFYNFSTMYCRDAGVPGPNEDIPALVINAVPQNPADRAQGILRQYLFTFSEPELKKDAIGLRIASNPLHLSPKEWYRAKGFRGSTEELQVDGYEAIRDGRTVYISAMSTDGPGEPMYSNIYIISYNDDAEPVTREIYDALLETMTFNTNLQQDIAEACQDANGNLIVSSDGLPVHCGADWECDVYGADTICSNFKRKVQRDMLRLSDFQEVTQALESAKDRDGTYPRLGSGSYLPGLSTSMWPSWEAAFTQAVLPQGGSLPTDPINRFVTCGRCSQSGTACIVADDCPRNGEECYAEDGFDPATCWNAQALQYRCPRESDDPSSRLYQYRSLDVGRRYELASEFEVPPPFPTNPSQSWWSPPLFEELRQCATPDEQGRFCQTDADCRTCPLGVCARCDGGSANGQACESDADCLGAKCTNVVPIVTGSCRAIGGRYRYTDVCEGQSYGQSSTCGDGVIDSDPENLKCLGGPNDGRTCQSSADCASYPCDLGEICETTGPTSGRLSACTTLDGRPGQKLQSCSGCRTYVDDLSQPGCFAVNECGNGRVDQGEACDDGEVNGTYGHCNLTCTGFGGYCGDSMLSLGEMCDYGFTGSIQNGGYCELGYACNTTNSCNLSCTGPGPYCGNLHVDAPQEECDGNTESTDKAICSDGNTPCDSDVDCPNGTTCGGEYQRGDIGGDITVRMEACGEKRVCIGAAKACSYNNQPCLTDDECNGSYGDHCESRAGWVCEDDAGICGNVGNCSAEVRPTVRTRTCEASTCNQNYWNEECFAAEFCGNGVVEGDEQCDDGNDDNEDGCTVFCRENICGDRFVYEGVEECDHGSGNGESCNTAEYGSTCTACSSDCKFSLTQGGFCGDGIVNPGSAEQCDTAGDPNAYAPPSDNLTCRALGFDYAKRSRSNGSDLITCSQSCGYTGCAYCGDVPADPTAAAFQGKIEGVLFDTLFQQPVPEARITLFYRGLQVAVTASNQDGYFEIDGLDRHDGCNQYRIVIDSYRDNPLTVNFDESLRQGYAPIETPSFEPDYRSAPVETSYTDAMASWGGDTRRVLLIQNPIPGRNYDIPRFNMLPRLQENEYVVQFWWEPLGGYEAVQAQFQNADPSTYPALYAQYQHELHDLVVRTPNMYAPGQFGGCTLPEAQEAYNPTRAMEVNENGVLTSYNGRNPSGSFIPGLQGVDHAIPYGGMYTCTNKVRASLSKTCRKHECNDTDNDPTTPCIPGAVVQGGDYGGRIGCVVDADCRNANQPSKHGLTAEPDEIIMCDGPPEPSRQGDIDVLSGGEGAYLFCFHPEYPIGSTERAQSQCANFVLPPQSVFISGKGGQYDILVSKYRLFESDWKMDIRNWLMARDASIVVYDRNGFNQELSVTRGARYGNGTWWGSDDGVPRWCYEQEAKECLGGPRNGRACQSAADCEAFPCEFSHDKYASYRSALRARMSDVSPVWTPLSIDTTNERYVVWNNGNAGADYQYFSDLVHREDFPFDGPGDNAGCYERACERLGYTDDGTTFPVGDYKVCGGSTGANAFPNEADGPMENSPACDEASRAACNPGTYCNTHVDDTVPCIRICDTYRDCQEDPRVAGTFRARYVFCGGVAPGPCGAGSSNPAIR